MCFELSLYKGVKSSLRFVPTMNQANDVYLNSQPRSYIMGSHSFRDYECN